MGSFPCYSRGSSASTENTLILRVPHWESFSTVAAIAIFARNNCYAFILKLLFRVEWRKGTVHMMAGRSGDAALIRRPNVLKHLKHLWKTITASPSRRSTKTVAPGTSSSCLSFKGVRQLCSIKVWPHYHKDSRSFSVGLCSLLHDAFYLVVLRSLSWPWTVWTYCSNYHTRLTFLET